MLGKDLVPYLTAVGYDVQPMHTNTLNLLATQDEIDRVIADKHPQIIVHGAAYTAVDQAEAESELAMAINKDGTRKLVLAAKTVGAIFVYISTDFVFDGLKQSPYTPQDRPNPINMYGLSKYYGELMVSELTDEYYIIRTSWLYGVHNRNFVQFVLESARQGREVQIAKDIHGTPTWTGSLCNSIERIMTSGEYGIHHASDGGIISRYDQARIICRQAGFSTEHIQPCNASDLTTPANRPQYSALDCGSLSIPSWETSLQAYLEQYNTLNYA